MSLPIEFDVSVGIRGQRVSFRYENLLPISDENARILVRLMEDTLLEFVGGLGSPTHVGEHTKPTGSVVSGETGPATTGPVEPPRGRPSKPRKPKPVEPWVEIETREERLARVARQREERINSRLAG